MALSSKQVAAIAEKMKADQTSTDSPKMKKGKPTAELKTPPQMQKSSGLKVPKSKAPSKENFKVSSISDLKKIRQQLKGEY